MAQETAHDMETIVGELCNNVVLHANGERFRMDLEYFADKVAVTVTDQGNGFSPDMVPAPSAPRTEKDGRERFGGFGLLLVKSMADYLTFEPAEPRGMAIRAEKKLRYESLAAENAARQLDNKNDLLASSGGVVPHPQQPPV